MKKIFLSVSILVLAAVACQSGATPQPPADPLTGDATREVHSPSATPVVMGTVTPTSLPQGIIFVDTLEHERLTLFREWKMFIG